MFNEWMVVLYLKVFQLWNEIVRDTQGEGHTIFLKAFTLIFPAITDNSSLISQIKISMLSRFIK